MRISISSRIRCTSVLAAAALGGSAAWGHSTLPVGCDPATPETCIYESASSYAVGVAAGLELTDPSRSYTVRFLVRYPIGALGPLPVVIWNHGGAPSSNGATRSVEWGERLARAGYVVIHPSRTPIPDHRPYEAECASNGFLTPDECIYWISQFRFGPQNTHFLIDHLADVELQARLRRGMLDASRIVVAGHSAGSATVLANAGAWQQWVSSGPVYDERDDAPIAFLATGVQGSMYAGFHSGFQSPGPDPLIGAHSFAGIERPFMFITGVGDETGEPSEARVGAWLTSQGGNKLLLWDTDPGARHETMDTDLCEGRRDPVVPEGHCEWIGSAGLAYLDAVVRGQPRALAWVQSGAIEVLSGGSIELHRR